MTFSPPSPYHGDLWAGRTVGLLGGSFNPAHEGHRYISATAIKRLGLDAVWWMVSPQNPLKSKKDMAPIAERIASAEAAKQHPQIVVTDIETQLGTRYTVDTLDKLRVLFPRTRFIWLMGGDNLHQIDRWKSWEDIFYSVHICVMDRPPRHDSIKASVAANRFRDRLVHQEKAATLTDHPLPAWTILRIPLNDKSSTAIRAARLQEKAKKGKVRA